MLKRSFKKMTFFIRDFLGAAAVEKIHDNGQEFTIAGRIGSRISDDASK